MRASALVFVLVLCACGSAEHAPASRPLSCTTISSGDGDAALAAYDRQIAALRALVRVPNLDTTPRTSERSARLARLQTQHAADTINALVLRARPYARDALIDPGAIEAQIENAYASETATIRAQAQQSQSGYQRALNAEASAQAATLTNAFNQRVNDAYNARLQLYTERESNAQVARARAVANRQLELRLKLDTLAQSEPQRHTTRAELDEISRTLASQSAAERALDRAALAVYLRTLQTTVSSQYARALADLQTRAAANLAIRQSVTESQLASPSRIPIAFDATLRAAMRTSTASLQSALSNTAASAAATGAKISASGADIARRMSTIGATDASNTANLRSELAAMRQARTALALAISASHHCATR